ncbi:uncharacterized protein LOC131651435 [Vicia villosa]|uniref:uncharacterized protein LOC131651435 n=1 Tax=Vicia villosa TaxID=3911 RepID=UPI00273CB711|nr:uncharacterized protein LOC131651435 [Vicia villosa]
MERKLEDTRSNEQETKKIDALKETEPTISGACENVTTYALTSKIANESSVRNESKSSSSCNVRENVVTSVGNIVKLQINKKCVAIDLPIVDGITKTVDENHSEEVKAKIVKRVLDDNHQVPRISFPLQTVIPDPPKRKSDDNDVHTTGSDIHMTEEENNEDVQEDADNTNVIEDVNDIGNSEADESQGQIQEQNSPVKKADVKSPSKDPVKKKSTSAELIKSRVVAKSVGVGLTKSWSKDVPKKRKARAAEESESDVEVNVNDIPLKKKPITSKLASSVPEVPIDNVSFHFAVSANRWKFVYQKRLALERELAQNARDCKDIMDLIEAAGLIKTVVHLSKCYEMLVKEFILDLSEDCADKRSKEFRKVFVRGKCVNFSSTVINNLLGRSDEAQPELEVFDNKVCQVITANQVRSWPLKGKLSASKLSMKYAMLHKIGAANWVPTNHKSTVSTVLGRFIYAVGTKSKFNYGTYILEQIIKHAGGYSVKGPIAFHSLIYDIILNQHPGILFETDSICKRESDLSFHYKLFQGTQVTYIVMTSTETSKSGSSASKADVITMLKETCKELEARKISHEKMINILEKDGNEDFAGAAGIEAQDEHEEGRDSKEEVDEGNTNLADNSDEESDADNSGGSESDE